MAKIIVRQITIYLKPLTPEELKIVLETTISELIYIADTITLKKKLNKGISAL